MKRQHLFESGFGPGIGICVLSALMALCLLACSDDVEEGGGANGAQECGENEMWHPIQERCVPDNGSGGGDVGDDSGDADEDVHIDDCGPGGTPTTIAGKVTIPAGTLPLPDVAVYVPPLHGNLPPMIEGATCEPCGDGVGVDALAETTTNIDGEFSLTNVPSGENIPLVVEVGKWRRKTIVPYVEECQVTQVDPDETRLPRNREEGDLPRFAVTTGECDALGCLLRKIGIDDSEFTPEDEEGRVHLFAGQGGMNQYSSSLNSGAPITPAKPWWDDVDNLLNYDIIAHSCECSEYASDKEGAPAQALLEFTEAGGRVFLSHFHYAWMKSGPSDFQDVADWFDMAAVTDMTETGLIDATFPKGQQLQQWMHRVTNYPLGEFPIDATRGSIEAINESIATQWVWIESEGLDWGDFGGFFPEPPPELVQYFSFNTPVYAPVSEQCGRVVFSDIHVIGGQSFNPEAPFPDGCPEGELTPQEKALVFMMFDLSRCIVPDKGSF